MKTIEPDFWDYLDSLRRSSQVVIERPKGSAHPRHPEIVYPFDYGFLQDTHAGDRSEVDVWCGSRHAPTFDGVVLTVDLEKRDLEVKLLIGCTSEDITQILAFHNAGQQRAWFVPRPGVLIA